MQPLLAKLLPVTVTVFNHLSKNFVPVIMFCKRSLSTWRKAGEMFQQKGEEYMKTLPKTYQRDRIAEFGELNRTGGKLISMDRLLPKGFQIPSGLTVHQCETNEAKKLDRLVSNGKVTVLLTSFRHIGHQMLETWTCTDTLSPEIQVVRLTICEDWYLKYMSSLIRRNITQNRQDTYLSFGFCDEFRTRLEMFNSFSGYVHLLDRNGRVRWISSGKATDAEQDLLVRFSTQFSVKSCRG